MARRPYDGQRDWNTYTASLIAPEERFEEDRATLEKILKSWKLDPCH
jgi:hypothetical protein